MELHNSNSPLPAWKVNYTNVTKDEKTLPQRFSVKKINKIVNHH